MGTIEYVLWCPLHRYPCGMPRPPRDAEARQLLVEYYSEQGVLPTVEVVAQLMGYRSTSSAHNTIQHLVSSGFLGQAEREGRLVPGPLFRAAGPQPPLGDAAPELAEAIRELAGDAPVQRVPVPDNSLSADGSRARRPLGPSPAQYTTDREVL